MTKKELIEALAPYSDDALIVYYDDDRGLLYEATQAQEVLIHADSSQSLEYHSVKYCDGCARNLTVIVSLEII